MQMADALELWNQLCVEQDDAIKTELIACVPFTQHKSGRLITARRAHCVLILKSTIGIGTNQVWITEELSQSTFTVDNYIWKLDVTVLILVKVDITHRRGDAFIYARNRAQKYRIILACDQNKFALR
jgi:hypothetical protein